MNSFLFFAVSFLSSVSLAQTSAELTCKAKAKEIAIQTYADCITTTKNAQIEAVRADYQSELAALKAKYDGKLKGISGGAPSKKPNTSATQMTTMPVAQSSASLPTKGVAKSLPKKAASLQTLDAQTVSEETPVVQMRAESDAIENEASQADMEVVDMPTE